MLWGVRAPATNSDRFARGYTERRLAGTRTSDGWEIQPQAPEESVVSINIKQPCFLNKSDMIEKMVFGQKNNLVTICKME